MTSLNIIKNIFSFYSATTQKFFSDAPQCFLSVISLKIISQILMLASFLVPIKVIFVLALGTFKPIHIEYIHYTISTKEHLALLLVGIVFSITLMYFVIEKVLTQQNDVCLKKILLNITKMNIYKKQNLLAKKIYLQYLNGLTGVVFFFISCGVIIVLSPLIIKIFLSYIFIFFFFFVFIYEKSIKVQNAFKNEFSKMLSNIFAFGFLAVFLGLVYDVTQGIDSVEAIFIVISFILLRRSADSLLSFFQSIEFLLNQKKPLEDIFFNKNDCLFASHHQNNISKVFLDVFWIENLLNKITQSKYDVLSVSRLDVEIFNEKIFTINAIHNNKSRTFILKIFDKNAELKANNEYLFLSAYENISNVPNFSGRLFFDDCWHHLFEINQAFKLITKKEFQTFYRDFRLSFESLQIPEILLNKYISTHKLVHEKILSYLQNSFIPISIDEKKIVDDFFSIYNAISLTIQSIPLQLHILGINHKNCILVDKELKLISLGKWSIEPLGYNLILNQKKDIADYGTNTQAIRILTVLKRCELNINQNQFSKLMENLEELVKLAKSLK